MVDAPKSLSGVVLAGDSWLASDTGIADKLKDLTKQPITNIAIGGATSEDVLNQLYDFFMSGGTMSPGSTMVLNVGGNDFLKGVDRGTTRTNLDKIVSLVGGSGGNVVLSGAPDVSSGEDISANKPLKIDPIYENIASKHNNVVLVDSMAGLLSQPELRTEDLIHLVPKGQEQFQNSIVNAFKTNLGYGPSPKATPLPQPPAPPIPIRDVVSPFSPVGIVGTAPTKGTVAIGPTQAGQLGIAQLPGYGPTAYLSQRGKIVSAASPQTIGSGGNLEEFNALTGASSRSQPVTSTMQDVGSSEGITSLDSGGLVPTVNTLSQAQPMATYTNQDIADYIKAIQSRGGGNAQIAAEMDRLGVSPAQVAAATGISTAEIQNLYNTVRPTGTYSTVSSTTTTSGQSDFEKTLANTVVNKNAGITTLPTAVTATPTATNDQLAAFKTALVNKDFSTAAALAKNAGFSVQQTTDYINTNPGYFGFNAPITTETVNTFFGQVPTTTPTTTTIPKFTSQQIVDYVKQQQALGKTNAELAADMDKFSVDVGQMAAATGVSPTVIQDMYNVANPRGRYSTIPIKDNVPGFERQSYAPVSFAQNQLKDLVLVQPTYEKTALLGAAAPGSPIVSSGISGIAAPAPYAGVPAAAPRPAANYPLLTDTSTKGIGNFINAMEGAGATTADLNAMYAQAGLTPAQVEAGQTAAITQGAPATGMKEGGLASLMKRNYDEEEDEYNYGLGGLLKGIGRGLKKAVKPIARILPFVAPFIPGVGPVMSAALSGIAGGFAGGKGFDFKRGLMTGMMSYGLANLAQGAGQAGNQMTPGPSTTLEISPSDISAAAPSVTPPGGTSPPVSSAPATFRPDLPAGSTFGDYAKGTLENVQAAGKGLLQAGMPGAAGEAARTAIGTKFGTGSAGMILSGTTGQAAIDEQAKYAEEQRRKMEGEAEDLRRKQQYAYGIMNQYPIRFSAEGGTINAPDEQGYDYAAGGLKEGSFIVPADVVAHLGNGSSEAGLKMLAKKYGAMPIKGPGDGMSDSIPTSIEGRQKARVADGEAIISPNTTARIGPKKLYSMLDKVRKARTGTAKQGRQINPMQYMPA